ncbi:hypothetical protein PENTCL1PPCAC_19076, partial [Pristionchus entomophagus]
CRITSISIDGQRFLFTLFSCVYQLTANRYFGLIGMGSILGPKGNNSIQVIQRHWIMPNNSLEKEECLGTRRDPG